MADHIGTYGCSSARMDCRIWAGWIGAEVPWSGVTAVSQGWDDGPFAGLEA